MTNARVYSAFEIRMGQIFHALYGSTTAPLEEQAWWGEIQKLKALAMQAEAASLLTGETA